MTRHAKETTMKTLMTLIAVAAIATIGCGDNQKALDASVHKDSSTGDGSCSNCPAVPALGPQMDRLGRPAINTVLNHGFDKTGAAGPAKDAYNQDRGTGGWPAAYTPQFMINLGIIDALDVGVTCTDGTCAAEAVPTPGDRCGNQVLYNGMPGGQIGMATASSYMTLGGILADDQLYLDTTQTSADVASSHANYLAVEFNVVTGLPNTTCGGRAPTNGVIATSYTALAIGITGFKASDGSFTPFFGDASPQMQPHADVSNTTFPFLGKAHCSTNMQCVSMMCDTTNSVCM